MKRILLLQFLLLFFAGANAQNEFAATAFYNQFKKVYDDGQSGFVNCRGEKRKSAFEELSTEYRVKCILPLADSAKLVIPVNGSPSVIYYFEPDKLRLKVDQRAVNLREAVLTTFDKPLHVISETSIVNNQPLTVTSFYSDEAVATPVIMRQLIYYQSGKFYISLEIKGIKK